MQEGSIPNLSEAHLSRIRITLTLLDEALVKFEEYAQGREVCSIFYCEENTLNSDGRAGILADIAGIRGLMQELKDDLHLKARSEDTAKTMQAHGSILWVDVLEMTGKYLRGFGEPPPELVNYLDPKAHRILQYLDHLKAMLNKSGPLG